MSDYEEEYDYGSEQEDIAEGIDAQVPVLEIENIFFEAEDLIKDDPNKAFELFQMVVFLERDLQLDAQFTFKALHHLVILSMQLGNFDEVFKFYTAMLAHISTVSRNECASAINKALGEIGTVNNPQLLSRMYALTLDALRTANYESLWFQTQLKLAKLYLESRRFDDMDNILIALKAYCQTPEGTEDATKATYLVDIYCLEAQFCVSLPDFDRLRQLRPAMTKYTNDVALLNPFSMGTIQFELGTMFMAENDYRAAYDVFREAFRHYLRSPQPRARLCLKYLGLASMLAFTYVNPFSAVLAQVTSPHHIPLYYFN